jgi:hypothetical protein
MSIPQSSSTELSCRNIGKSLPVTILPIFPRVMCNQAYLELCVFMESSKSQVRSSFQTYSVRGKVRPAPLSGYVTSWILEALTEYDTGLRADYWTCLSSNLPIRMLSGMQNRSKFLTSQSTIHHALIGCLFPGPSAGVKMLAIVYHMHHRFS